MILNLFDRMKLPFRKNKEFLSALYDILGFYPHNMEIYRVAFSHKSLTYRRDAAPKDRKSAKERRQKSENTSRPLNNERLEYLGDAVLETVVSDILFRHFDHKREGFLTSTRSKIVQREALNRLAEQMGLEKLILAAQGTRMSHTNIGGNAFEALMGAIYLDRGFKYCHWFITHRVIGPYVDLDSVAQKEVNFKSKLLEWCQKNRINTNMRDYTNSDGEKGFRTVIVLEGITVGKGTGRSKKDSQQVASKDALVRMRKEPKLYDSIFRAKEKRTAMEADESFALPRLDEIEGVVRSAKDGRKPVLEGNDKQQANPLDAAYDAAYDESGKYDVITDDAADSEYSEYATHIQPEDNADEVMPDAPTTYTPVRREPAAKERKRERTRTEKSAEESPKAATKPVDRKAAAAEAAAERRAERAAKHAAKMQAAAEAQAAETSAATEDAAVKNAPKPSRRERRKTRGNDAAVTAVPETAPQPVDAGLTDAVQAAADAAADQQVVAPNEPAVVETTADAVAPGLPPEGMILLASVTEQEMAVEEDVATEAVEAVAESNVPEVAAEPAETDETPVAEEPHHAPKEETRQALSALLGNLKDAREAAVPISAPESESAEDDAADMDEDDGERPAAVPATADDGQARPILRHLTLDEFVFGATDGTSHENEPAAVEEEDSAAETERPARSRRRGGRRSRKPKQAGEQQAEPQHPVPAKQQESEAKAAPAAKEEVPGERLASKSDLEKAAKRRAAQRRHRRHSRGGKGDAGGAPTAPQE